MSSPSGFRNRLVLQAALTALFALTGSSAATGWTIPTLVVAAAAVFVGLALRAEPQWRTIVLAFEAVAVGFGLLGLVAGHYVPGTLVGGWTLALLLSADGASAFAGTPAGTPSWAPAPADTTPEPYGGEAAAPVPVPVAAPVAVAVPEQPVPVAAPVAVAVPEPVPVAVPEQPVPVAAPVAVAVPEQPAPVVAVAVPEPAPPVVPAAPLTRPAALTVLPGK